MLFLKIAFITAVGVVQYKGVAATWRSSYGNINSLLDGCVYISIVDGVASTY